MKIVRGFIIIALFSFIGCREKIVEFNEETEAPGIIYVSSSPIGASIYWNNWDVRKSTPDSLINVHPGIHEVGLRRAGYKDTTVVVYMQSGNRARVNINLITTAGN